MSKYLRGLSGRKGLKPGIFQEITEAAGNIRTDSNEILNEIAERNLVGKSSVLGASTFYEFLREEHLSKKVFICNGTACLTSGKQKKLKDGLLGLFREDEIGIVTCLGHCHPDCDTSGNWSQNKVSGPAGNPFDRYRSDKNGTRKVCKVSSSEQARNKCCPIKYVCPVYR